MNFKGKERSKGKKRKYYGSGIIGNPNKTHGRDSFFRQGSSTTAQMSEDEKVISQTHHAQEIPTPKIYESPKVTTNLVQKKETAQIPLWDINFPPRVSKPSVGP